ncbi:MAG TPA: tRNA 2-selenouridine(34) synthase MnmH, partial [Chitinophagaceae bacterium]|nr:tRNA 2-selenouridine(34) synthase MnmH [Chitinophagaceae bacterium]
MLELNQQVYPFIILGGKTGSAKTETLHALREAGEQVIDLEALAHHQGSSFGSMGNPYQPSQEQFENHLAEELSKMNLSRRIWLENESVGIGKRIIPKEIFRQMREARVIQIELPYSERLEFLNNTYGKLDPEFLTTSVLKISKRLGPNETKLSVQAIAENRIEDFIKQVLVYYDKTYERSVSNRLPETVYSLPLNTLNPVENAKAVLQLANQIR